ATDAEISVIFIFFENMMKYKIYVGLLSLFSFIRHTEWWYQNDRSDFNEKISLYFILTYISLIVTYLIYKSKDKCKLILVLIMIINILLMIIQARVYIAWLHVLD